MLETTTTQENGVLTVAPAGRLDTTNASDFEKEIFGQLDGITKVVFDMKQLEYISSAGLRILLSVQKKLADNGKMTLTNVSGEVMEILDITGFVDIFEIA